MGVLAVLKLPNKVLHEDIGVWQSQLTFKDPVEAISFESTKKNR